MFVHVDYIIRNTNISRKYFNYLLSRYEIQNRVLLSFADIDFLLYKLDARSYKTLGLIVFLADLVKDHTLMSDRKILL